MTDQTAEAPASARMRLLAAKQLAPGVLVSVVVALAAQFISEHYGAPAMLMALLLGIAFNFLSEEGRCVAGIEFTAKMILRVGVALLGARISVELLMALGGDLIALVLLGVCATIGFGWVVGRLLGHDWRLSVLTAGSVAICGASAAMAIAAVLPKNEQSERNLLFTVMGVTVLSTMAMIFYPILAEVLGLDHRETGAFLGGSIHDVAQVVGAGFSVSEETGEKATLVKLFRVTMLAPVVLLIALAVRRSGAAAGEGRPPLIPGFVLVFFGLAALNSAHLLPSALATGLGDLSRWALIASIAAVGMKTNPKKIFEMGGPAIALIVGETLFIAVFLLGGLWLLA